MWQGLFFCPNKCYNTYILYKTREGFTVNILVIGNGFDLAHGLPTSYMDFLNFMNYSVKNYKDKTTAYQKEFYHEPIRDGLYGFLEIFEEKAKNHADKMNTIVSFKNKIFDNRFVSSIFQNKALDYEKIFGTVLKSNYWLNYFNMVKDSMQGKNWIDFEAEISKVVSYMEEYNSGAINERNNDLFEKFGFQPFGLFNIADPEKRQEELEKIKNTLYKELESFISCLELYLLLINEIPPYYKSPDICGLDLDAVLSFNYTDTFSIVYNKMFSCKLDFIHGKAGEHNIVLGAKETLINSGERNTNVFCVQFKKFFQRINKQTGLTYKNWFSKLPITPNDPKKHNVFIFGHSLDVTDQDVLEYIITHKNVSKTTIYYHDEDAHARYIANLMQVIGKNEVIQRMRFSDNIVLKKQAAMVPIES